MSAHEAGRELDALVAERVMGGTISRGVMHYDGAEMPFAVYRGAGEIVGCGVPPFSTDIAAAWTVVEKLSETQCDFSLERAGDDNWYAMTALAPGRGNTAPLAICRAALAAQPPTPGATEP